MTFKIAYGLPLSEMIKWGLYISEPRRCALQATAWAPYPTLPYPGGVLHVRTMNCAP